MKVVYTLNALIDLDQIREYIAERADRETASRFTRQMEAAIADTLSVFPYGSRTRTTYPEGCACSGTKPTWRCTQSKMMTA